ncbi:MAG: hypothetical protein KTR32_25015 [Granulosicoccus sp.]|nr:hypothetical protein [Granulosicoccus sp.]
MIRRLHIHVIFALLTTCLLIAVIYHWHSLHAMQSLSLELKTIPDIINDEDEVVLTDSMIQKPEVQLAAANALSRGGNLSLAEAGYNKLMKNQQPAAISQAARFNLANAYLRHGLTANEGAARIRPMLELAKQRYRDLLRESPMHWDARYNLELALRLAPELSASSDEDGIDPIKRVRVIVPGFEKQDLP